MTTQPAYHAAILKKAVFAASLGVALFATALTVASDSAADSAAAPAADLPWTTWKRSAERLQAWPELGVADIAVYRQTFDAVSETVTGEEPKKPESGEEFHGAVYFVISAQRAAAGIDRIDFPRLDNPVQRVWWWPLGDTQAVGGETEGGGFEPPVERQVKLTQTPTVWTLAIAESEGLVDAARSGGVVVVMDLVGEPVWSEEPQLIRPGKNGAIVLNAHHGKTYGKLLQYEPLPHKNTIGYWVEPNDFAKWRIEVPIAAKYRVEIYQGCGTGQGGSRIAIGFGGEAVETIVEETGHFQNFRWRDIGEIMLQPNENLDVTLRCLEKAQAAVVDIRQIRLVPAE
jgi:hypothetical protein